MKLTTDTAAMNRWLKTARTAQSRADYACAIEHNVARRTEWRATAVMVVLAACTLLAIFGGYLP